MSTAVIITGIICITLTACYYIYAKYDNDDKK